MAAINHKSVIRVAPPIPNVRPADNTVRQNGSRSDDNRQTDRRRNQYDVIAVCTDGEHIYDELNLGAARAETGQSHNSPLNSDQTSVNNNIHTKLDSLEQNQQRLAAQFEHSQKQILSELCLVKDMVSALSGLVRTSLATAQKTSAEQQHRVQELAANLGQEVFQVGQEVMETIRERNDADLARQAWRQELDTNSLTSLASRGKKNSKRNALPSL